MKTSVHLPTMALLLASLALPAGVLADDDESGQSRFDFPSLYPETRIALDDEMSINTIDHGSGFPVVFIHGLGADHHQWNDNIPAFAERFRVLALDFPGHGKSDRVSGYDYGIPKNVEALLRFLDERQIERAVLIGNSMGGQVALYTALHHPERVERLILVDAAGGRSFPRWKQRIARIGTHPAVVGLLDPDVAGTLDGLVVQRRQDAPITNEMKAKIVHDLDQARSRRAYLEVVQVHLESIFAHDLSEDLHRIDRPALIVWGTHDLLVPVTHAIQLRRRLPRSRIVFFGGAGHVPSLEEPERFNRIALRYLGDLARPGAIPTGR